MTYATQLYEDRITALESQLAAWPIRYGDLRAELETRNESNAWLESQLAERDARLREIYGVYAARIAALETELSEVRSERQREHDLRVKITGTLEARNEALRDTLRCLLEPTGIYKLNHAATQAVTAALADPPHLRGPIVQAYADTNGLKP